MYHMVECADGMMWGMGLLAFLSVLLLVLLIAALVKYLFFPPRK